MGPPIVQVLLWLALLATKHAEAFATTLSRDKEQLFEGLQMTTLVFDLRLGFQFELWRLSCWGFGSDIDRSVVADVRSLDRQHGCSPTDSEAGVKELVPRFTSYEA